MTRTPSVLQGLPDDLLDSDHPYLRSVKVSLQNLTELQAVMLQTFNELIESNKNIEKQLKLLNARSEEAWNTEIEECDV